jgi:hypothetical protein
LPSSSIELAISIPDGLPLLSSVICLRVILATLAIPQ